MYSKRSGLIVGFHGCDKSIRDKVLTNPKEGLKPSNNTYDWLGSGIYFWENNYQRALDYANELKHQGKIKNPSVIGAVIDLGYCLDLLDSEYLEIVKVSYEYLKEVYEKTGLEIPVNKSIGRHGDLLLRPLDCAVIETVHQTAKDFKELSYDSVKGVFYEGGELYPGAGFTAKNHIQVAIRNPNSIKGYFLPRQLDSKYPKP